MLFVQIFFTLFIKLFFIRFIINLIIDWTYLRHRTHFSNKIIKICFLRLFFCWQTWHLFNIWKLRKIFLIGWFGWIVFFFRLIGNVVHLNFKIFLFKFLIKAWNIIMIRFWLIIWQKILLSDFFIFIKFWITHWNWKRLLVTKISYICLLILSKWC